MQGSLNQLTLPKSRSSVKTKIMSSPFSSFEGHTILNKTRDAQSSMSASALGFNVEDDCTTQSLKSNVNISPFAKKRIVLPRTKLSKVPRKTAKAKLPDPVTSRTISGFCVAPEHLSTKFQKLSSSERMFVLHVYTWGLSTANYLAAKFHYKLRQPLPVLLEALGEVDKNCTKRSAKPKQLSNGKASLSKRSLGAMWISNRESANQFIIQLRTLPDFLSREAFRRITPDAPAFVTRRLTQKLAQPKTCSRETGCRLRDDTEFRAP
jgi:hypothetical protein